MQHIWGRGEVHTVSWWGYIGTDGGMILKWIFKKWCGVHGQDDLDHDRDRSEVLVNAVLNLWVMVYVTVTSMERCTAVQ